jgi:hypothetical protein
MESVCEKGLETNKRGTSHAEMCGQLATDSSTSLVNCNCRLSGCIESRGRLVEMCGHQAGYAAFGFGSSSHCYGNR